MKLNDPGSVIADAVEDIAANLYRHLSEKIEQILREQLTARGIDINDPDQVVERCARIDYPNDPHKFATYLLDGEPILTVKSVMKDMSHYFEFEIAGNKEARGGSECS